MRFLVFILSLFLIGCGTPVTTRVSSFHQIEHGIIGDKYVIVPLDSQEASLEFKSYADLIRQALSQKGMIETDSGDAKYAIFIEYGINDGRTVNRAYPIIGQTGVSSSYTTGYVNRNGTYAANTNYTPTYGVVGAMYDSDTEFTRFLKVELLLMPVTEKHFVKAYEGKAVSSGSSSQLSLIMPYMVKSVFAKFPGDRVMNGEYTYNLGSK
jgi:hypothetical protein